MTTPGGAVTTATVAMYVAAENGVSKPSGGNENLAPHQF